MSFKKCDFCNDVPAKYRCVVVNNDINFPAEQGLVCPECIASWFTEDPDNTLSLNLIKLTKEEAIE